MKKTLLYGMIIIIFCSVVFAGSFTKTLTFSSTDIEIKQIEHYSIVQLRGTLPYQEIGAPIVPVAIYNVLVPANATITEIKVLATTEHPIDGKYLLYPAQEPKPISHQAEILFTEPNQAIYGASSVYPAKIVDYTSTGTKSGYRLGSFAVFPVRYYPQTQQLGLITNLTLEFIYEENRVSPEPITHNQKEFFAQDVKNLIINPEDIERFSPPVNFIDQNEIDCIIITSDALASNFQSLIEWHNKKGFRTEVRTTTWITSNYAGRDQQEKIRNFIRDYFTTRGLKWVILGGDNAIVPCRRTRAIVNTYIGNIPADLYYADLQWSWDGNNNNIFGETTDTVDFFADLYVGRLSVDNATEISNNINKIFTYEKNPDSTYIKKILLPAAYLWSNYNHMLSQDSIERITPPDWIDRKINLGQNDALRYLVRDSLNNGFGFAHLVGHGDDVGVYIYNSAQYNTSDPATQTNSSKLVIVNSIACYPGNFEYNDCLAERMMNVPNCAVAVIMNSRYGWGTPPVIGPSELLDIAFYDFFFRQDSSLIGPCSSTAKDAYRYFAETQQVWRWCVFELNLFGDPLLPMWRNTPRRIQISRPDTIQTGPQTITVTVTQVATPVSNVLVGFYKNGEVWKRGKTNSNGQVTLVVNANTTGKMYITATGANCYPLEDSITVVTGTPMPYITLDSLTLSTINPNQTVNFYAIVTNTGNGTATNTMGKLRTNSNYISIIDSVSNYGTIAVGAQAIGDLYTFYVSGNTPCGTQIPFTLTITADQGTWNFNFNVFVGQAPQPGMIAANHDTGYCLLTVTALGSIGYTNPADIQQGLSFIKKKPASSKIGSGFRYPKSALSALYYSSMLSGNSSSYVADRFYGQPATTLNQDWSVMESLRFVLPPSFGNQHLQASYTDAGHPSPKGLKVIQNSYSLSDSRYDDFVVLVFEYQNTGTTTINGLYSGIISDFDIKPESSATDIARSDVNRRAVYMRRAVTQNPTVGMKLLYPLTAANLTCIDHAIYVYPESAMNENMKYRILNGGINVLQSNRTYDWSVALSAGPFNLAPSQTYRVAYAFVGGNSEATFLANCDSAQAWFNQYVGITDALDRFLYIKPTTDFTIIPNVGKKINKIAYQISKPGRLTIRIYDISGKLQAELFNDNVKSSSGIIEPKSKQLANGVYFIKLTTAEESITKKFLDIE